MIKGNWKLHTGVDKAKWSIDRTLPTTAE